MTLFRILLFFAVLSIISVQGGCAYNKATGTNQFNFISDKEEIEIGRNADPSIRAEFGVYPDEALTSYVDEVGQRVVVESGRANIPYTFTVLDSPVINAFALPGGWLYVTRGILAQMNSEAELAFVLGHEISHVAAKHGAQRISQAQSLQVGFIAAQLLLGQQTFQDYGRIAATVADLALRGYGRENEFEADLLGVEYAIKANYDPEEGAEFLKTLKRQEKFEPSFLQNMLSTHPPTAERIERVNDKIHEILATKNNESIDYNISRDRYLDAIDGMSIGNVSALGKIVKESNRYFNYQFGFTFPLILKWELKGSLDAPLFTMKYRDVTGKVFTHRRKNQESVSAFAGRHMAKGEVIQDTGKNEKGVHYLYTRHKGLSEKVDGKSVKTKPHLSYYFLGDDYGVIWRFDDLDTSHKLFADVSDMAMDFRFLTDEEIKENGGLRQIIYTVKAGDTLDDIAKKYFPRDEEGAARIAAYNNIDQDKPLPRGSRLKIPPDEAKEKKDS